MHIQAVQTSLFHQRKQGERETVDSLVQALRVLFHILCYNYTSVVSSSIGLSDVLLILVFISVNKVIGEVAAR